MTRRGGESRPDQEADVEASKVARAPVGGSGFDGVRPGRPGPHQISLCEPWRDIIVAKLEGGLTAQRIYQDLVSEHGFAGKYSSVRRFARRLERHQPLPFRRMECGPGEEAQVETTHCWVDNFQQEEKEEEDQVEKTHCWEGNLLEEEGSLLGLEFSREGE